MTVTDFEGALRRYAELAIRTGLNLQPGQALLLADPSLRYGVPAEAAPMVRKLARAAFAAGARSVEPLWGDSQITRLGLDEQGEAWIEGMPTWRFQASAEHVAQGGAYLSLHCHAPNLLEGLDEGLATKFLGRTLEAFSPTSEVTTANKTNWCVIAIPVAGWADLVFPDLAPDERLPRLWREIFRICRLDRPDPVAAWETNVKQLNARMAYLNARAYHELHYRSDGTDLRVGLAEGHRWLGGGTKTTSGVSFIPNLPTEEVYTLPDRMRADGQVTASMPLCVGGRVIKGMRLRLERGAVVEAHADTNESFLKSLLKSDEGACRLGEAALVPNSSPIAQSGTLFYDTLIDENAACHLALGRGYRATIGGGQDLDDPAFLAAGGNLSMVHADFMLGSGQLDIDGVRADGQAEPVMRSGEWAFDAP
jgi:aminopeptidase